MNLLKPGICIIPCYCSSLSTIVWTNLLFRPPGIYKEDYINELFQLYGDIDDAPPAPALPMWHCEADDTSKDEPEAEGILLLKPCA